MSDAQRHATRTRDRYLLLALLLAGVLSLYGLWWGWAESWNPDEMAFRGLFARGHFLEPTSFEKPPFHTYVNLVLSRAPFKIIEWLGKSLTGQPWLLKLEMLWWSRILQIGFFLGCVFFTYRNVERFSSLNAARIAALLTATSAGFVLQTHFLTADIPVAFWMLASFYAAQGFVLTGRMRDYLAAGLLVGIATATKYNGLAVGLAIPLFHLFAADHRSYLGLALDRRFLLSLAMVMAGFIVANPYSVLDYRQFVSDFAYNYVVTPVYGGTSTGYGFGDFLLSIPEIIGWPVTALVVAAVILAVGRLRAAHAAEQASVLAALGVFLLYFLQFGRAPRVEIRFVEPIVPFLLIAAAPLYGALMAWRMRLAAAAATLLVTYNVCASYWVGKRFAEDPRMGALTWLASNVSPGSAVESSQYAPTWSLYPKLRVDDVRMPPLSGRARTLSKAFQANGEMMEEVLRREQDNGVDWYRPQALKQRRPQFVVLDSKYFDRFLRADVAALDYPAVRKYMTELLGTHLGYHVVFDRTARDSPAWLYPRDIDFVDNRIVILQRDVP